VTTCRLWDAKLNSWIPLKQIDACQAQVHVAVKKLQATALFVALLAKPNVACFCSHVHAAMQCHTKSFYEFLDDGSVRYAAASLRHLACEQRSEEEHEAAQQAAENAAEEQKQATDGLESELHEQQSAEQQQQAQHAQQQQQQQKVMEHLAKGCSVHSKVFPARPMPQQQSWL
jgi:flagellar biosynthesis GTPase FlhF